jgi:hypothetical protein
MPSPTPITRGQFLSVLLVAALAGGVYVWPSWLVTLCGPNAFWGLLASILVAGAAMALRLVWMRAVPAANYVAALRGTVGPVLTWPLFGLERASALGLDGLVLSLYGSLLRAAFYPRTPTVLLLALIAAAAAWIGGRPVADVARNVQFWSLFLGLSAALLLALAIPLGHNWLALVPTAHLRAGALLTGVSLTGYLWVQDEVVLTFGHAVAGGWRRRMRPALLSVGIGALLLTLFLGTPLLLLGPEAVANLYWPLVYTFSIIVVRLSLVTHLGLFVLFLWTVGMALYTAIRCCSASLNTLTLVGGHPRAHPWLTLAYALATWGVALAVPGTTEASGLLEADVSPMLVYADLGLLLALVGWLAVRGRLRPPDRS